MSADKLAETTPDAPKFICPNCLPKPKVLDFNEKRLHWASVVRVYSQKLAKTNNHREVFINKNTFAFNKNKKRTRLWSISGKKRDKYFARICKKKKSANLPCQNDETVQSIPSL